MRAPSPERLSSLLDRSRAPLTVALVLGLLGTVACTQDFSTFDPGGGGSGGAGAGAPTTGASTTDTSTGPTTTSASTTSTSGPGGGQGGGGQGGGCQGPADCDDDNPCTTDACDGGECSSTALADGPLVDDPEDCRTIECVGGEVSDLPNDDEDPPDANPPCETTICSGGEITPSFAPAGTDCGDPPLTCDGAGTCGGCDPEGVEPCGPPTACSVPVCLDGGACDPGFLPTDTPVPDPVDGDCQRDACTGDAALPASVADDTDLPADLPCGDRGCAAGAITTQLLPEGTACVGAVGVCDGLGSDVASCRTCRDTAANTSTDAGCTAGTPICDELADGGEGRCMACLDTAAGSGTDLGCPGSQVCDPSGTGACVTCYTDGGDVAVNCPAGEVCEPGNGGTCRTCYDLGDGVLDAGCAAPTEACAEVIDACVECQGNGDCAGNPNGPDCTENFATECGCSESADCAGNPQGHVCRLVIGKDVCGCNAVGDCEAGATSCTGNVCVY